MGWGGDYACRLCMFNLLTSNKTMWGNSESWTSKRNIGKRRWDLILIVIILFFLNYLLGKCQPLKGNILCWHAPEPSHVPFVTRYFKRQDLCVRWVMVSNIAYYTSNESLSLFSNEHRNDLVHSVGLFTNAYVGFHFSWCINTFEINSDTYQTTCKTQAHCELKPSVLYRICVDSSHRDTFSTTQNSAN